jgi:hypothetical protein
MKTLSPWAIALLILAAAPAAVAAGPEAASPAPLGAEDELKIAALLEEFSGMGAERLEVLPARLVERFQLPTPGVDVMRARLVETYSVDGIGSDTVELSGWIAVRHGKARAASGEGPVSWETAVVDTQFVGLELTGRSALFGDVRVGLDRSRPLPVGQVGRIEIPELAAKVLLAQAGGKPVGDDPTPNPAFNPRRVVSFTVGNPAQSGEVLSPLTDVRFEGFSPALKSSVAAGSCRAALSVSVNLSAFGLTLRTERPVYWYSIVDTIPPVGHTASVTVEPVPLVAEDGRVVGTLESGEVKFREVVRFVRLSDEPIQDGVWTAPDRIAASGSASGEARSGSR